VPENLAPITDPDDLVTKSYVDARTPVIVVLGKTDPLPGGTAVGTVIVRKDV
jgi:hypothetical protein